MNKVIFILCALVLLAHASFVGCTSGKKEKEGGKTHFDSYNGLVMAGYQGWFNAPEDGAERGWYHYRGKGGFKPGASGVEMWADVSEYEKLYETDFVMKDGSPAKTFSSYDESTVDTHFRWMKEYNLDGVFMQRFVVEIKNEKGKNHFNKVLASAMKSANKYERAICVMYDLSGMRSDDISILLADFDEVVEAHNIKDRSKNPSYLYHNGKPLVTIWGVGFNDDRKYDVDDVRKIVHVLKVNGFSIMLGVPTYWRTLNNDTVDDPNLHALIKECDIIMPWFVGRYTEHSYDSFIPLIKDDIKWAQENDVDYVPLSYPGFSWKNLKQGDPFNVPRNKGSFLWKQMSNALNSDAKALYIAMFDEIDEGTAIFKCAEDVPVGTGGSTFVPIEEGIESDHYLWLVGEANRMLKKEIPLSAEMPKR